MLDEIEDFSFDVTHLPCSRNPTDPLSGRRRPAGLNGRSGPGEPAGAVFVAGARRPGLCCARCHSLRVGHAPQAGGGGLHQRRAEGCTPLHRGQGGGEFPPARMFVALAGAELALGTGTTPAPAPPVPSDAHFLAPAFVQALVRELDADAFLGPIMRGTAGTLGEARRSARCSLPRHLADFLDASRTTPVGAFLVRCGLLYRRGQVETDRLCIPWGGDLRAMPGRSCSASATTGR